MEMQRQTFDDPFEFHGRTHWTRILSFDLATAEARVGDDHADAANAPDLIERRPAQPAATPANDDFEAFESPASGWLSTHELHQAARRHRAAVLRMLVVAATQSVRDIVGGTLARYRRHRDMKAIYDTLQALDDASLRDLGFHRSEILSVAAEAMDEAERTRVRTIQSPRAPRT